MKGDRRIYKYAIQPWVKTLLPVGAEIISVGQQGDHHVCWAIVDPDAPMEQRDISTFPTGSLAPPTWAKFIGTVQRTDGLVFHFFDCSPNPTTGNAP